MDAWETLLDNSTLASTGFDAWEHLNAQEGGGEGVGSWVLVDGMALMVDNSPVEVELSGDSMSVEVGILQEILVTLPPNNINVSLSNGGNDILLEE